MKKIGVVTATRAEYGVLKNLIREMDKDAELQLCLIVTGTHLSEQYGSTIQEIMDDGYQISEQVPILAGQDDELGIIQTMGNAAISFGKLFSVQRLDMIVVVGDRYELLPICQSAVVFGIPITHISGGEITEGCIDDIVRNAVTKMSHLHFPGCEIYRQRVIQMGEEPQRVFNYGDIGVENLVKMDYMTKKELENSLELPANTLFASVTFHPATAESNTAETQVKEVLKALESYPNIIFIITKANADMGGQTINKIIDQFVLEHSNCRAYCSLGIKRYLSLLKFSQMIIGNSSSGIIEAPSFGIPTINIGDRQKGRLQASSIINCEPKTEKIVRAINVALTPEHKEIAQNTENPYGSGNTSQMVVAEIKKFLKNHSGIQKKFYDLK